MCINGFTHQHSHKAGCTLSQKIGTLHCQCTRCAPGYQTCLLCGKLLAWRESCNVSWLVQINVQMPFLFAPQASPFHTIVQCSSQSTDTLRNAANLFAVATGVGREFECELGYAGGALNILSLRPKQSASHTMRQSSSRWTDTLRDAKLICIGSWWLGRVAM